MALITVIIPTYNRSKAVTEAVKSALSQTHVDLEILVCDDGSDDDTRRALDALTDSRLRFVEGGHAGRPSVPRNRGIGLARGEYLAFLDSDDQWLPDKISRQLDIMRARNSQASCTNAWCLTPDRESRRRLIQSSPESIGFGELLIRNTVVCSSVLVHRSLFRAAGGFPETPLLTALEDYALWLRVVSFARFTMLDEPLVLYRDAPSESLRDRCAFSDWHDQQAAVLGMHLAWLLRHPAAWRTFSPAVARYLEIRLQSAYGAMKAMEKSLRRRFK